MPFKWVRTGTRLRYRDPMLAWLPHFGALCNFAITILIVWAFIAIRRGDRDLHPKLMKVAIVLGAVFLVSDRKSTRLNSSHVVISYAVFCLKKTAVGSNAKIFKSTSRSLISIFDMFYAYVLYKT